MNNRTFAIIKPDAVKNKHTGLIYDEILKSNFKILSSKLIKMTKKQAENFYLIYKVQSKQLKQLQRLQCEK